MVLFTNVPIGWGTFPHVMYPSGEHTSKTVKRWGIAQEMFAYLQFDLLWVVPAIRKGICLGQCNVATFIWAHFQYRPIDYFLLNLGFPRLLWGPFILVKVQGVTDLHVSCCQVDFSLEKHCNSGLNSASFQFPFAVNFNMKYNTQK